MLRIHFVQQWFGLSDPPIEDALHDMPVFREFAGLEGWDERLPGESTISRFRHVAEKNKLAGKILKTDNELFSAKCLLLESGTVVDATLIAAHCSTKNCSGEREPEKKKSKKGDQWYFGMKCHIGVDIESGLVHTVKGTGSHVHDVNEANSLVRGSNQVVYGDAGYQGTDKRSDARVEMKWNVAMRPGKRRKLDPAKPIDVLIDLYEKTKAGIPARVEHTSRILKRQFGYVKVRYRGLAKNTGQLHTLFAPANLWLVRRKLLPARA